jgi:NAD-dependent deacetylase
MRSMGEPALDQAAALLRGATRVAVLTGAGVSAESGVPTFRGGGGLWEGQPVEQVATPEAFLDDPERVWRFYEQRRRNLLAVRPNPAHGVLARWQEQFPRYTLITQNVDGLHQEAGAREVLELHGNIWRVRCAGCGCERLERTVPLPELPPRCAACGALERPAVVWFGEMLPQDVLAQAWEAAERAQVLVVVGTSAVVYPAAGLLEVTARHGGTVVEVNPEPSALAFIAAIALRGPAGDVLPRLAARIEGPR